MSFSGETKNSLCEIFIKKECCALSQLWGILRFCSTFDENNIRLLTHHESVVKLTLELLDRYFGIQGELHISARENQRPAYRLTLWGEDVTLLRQAYHFEAGEKGIGTEKKLFRCSKCAAHFVRGVFLSAGSIADPKNSYHLDLTVGSMALADDLEQFLGRMGLPPKRTVRKGLPVLYYKGSESIEDFLTFTGATKSVFTVMDTKILKEIINDTNRKQNFDLANMTKTVTGAQEHIAAIEKLKENGKLALLPPQLQETAKLRLENPELSLIQLAQSHEPRLTKSGLNHRLKKIMAMAKENVRTGKEENHE